MSKRVTSIVAVAAALALSVNTPTTEAFAPATLIPKTSHKIALTPRFAEETKESEAAFKPVEEEDEDEDDSTLDMVEKLGRGAAKVSVLVNYENDRCLFDLTLC